MNHEGATQITRVHQFQTAVHMSIQLHGSPLTSLLKEKLVLEAILFCRDQENVENQELLPIKTALEEWQHWLEGA